MMKAIGFERSLPVEEARSLFLFDTDMPSPEERDLLVEIKAVSVNPVDAKVRIRSAVENPHETPKILGYDAVGIVRKTGYAVKNFVVGDVVWYAGDINRPGSNAEFQLVDERIAGHKPSSLSDSDAATFPLTCLTAWEMLFDRFALEENGGEGQTLLVIGGAGGVGSQTIQIAKALTKLNVIATASRPETAEWCRNLGADLILNHNNLLEEAAKHNVIAVEFITQYADTAQHWDAMCELVAPQGKVGTIVETDHQIDISKLQGKSASLHWELMFTRSIFQTIDLERQHEILERVASLVDAQQLRSICTKTFDGFSADSFKQAHRMIETNQTIGKIAINYNTASG